MPLEERENMKLKSVIAGLALSCQLVYAQVGKIEEEVIIPKYDKKLIELIQSHPDLTVDHLDQHGFELYGPKGMKAWLNDMGVEYKEREQASGGFLKTIERASYPSFSKITKKLKSLAKKYPNIAKLDSVGKSVQGRDLWVLKISDNVEVDEVEPEFKYISSMHGDEITGRELLTFLAEDMLKAYGTDPKITELINNTEIYIMPSMNPDGSKRRRRANANGYDLNRNFPHWDAAVNSTNKRQPETVAVMNFQAQRQFSLSANFHGGAVCVNYPWDSTLDRHPLDSLIQDLSLRYSRENGPMYNSRSFENGITNGADWYVVKGGMQDWSYVFHNDLQITVELSQRKWPSYFYIPQYYKENKQSMLSYMSSIHQGAGFKVGDNRDGSVKVTNITNGQNVDLGKFGFKSGEFYKVLPEGLFRFEVFYDDQKTYDFELDVVKDRVLKDGNYMFINLGSA